MAAVLSDRDRLRQRATGGEELTQPPQQAQGAIDKYPKARARGEPFSCA
jgi:hypothetical protein